METKGFPTRDSFERRRGPGGVTPRAEERDGSAVISLRAHLRCLGVEERLMMVGNGRRPPERHIGEGCRSGFALGVV